MSLSTPLPLAPPPWSCKCTAYILPWYNSSSSGLPHSTAYAPLEATTSAFSAEKDAGTYKGGLCFAQIIRYTDTPVGAYDELALLPGAFAGPDGKGKDLRITGIWVSSEASLMNGRRNWNIPKHLARFTFTPKSTSPSSSVKVSVFPLSPSTSPPFFSAEIHPISYTPSFPFSSSWLGFLGFSSRLLQPPLPKGEPAELEVGTEGWRRSSPVLKSKRARAVWIDMRQESLDHSEQRKAAGGGQEEGDTLLVKKNENWWPGMGRWQVGLWCQDAILELGEPDMVFY